MFKPVQTLSRRLFKSNKGRNIVAVLAIILTTLMFTTLFVLSQSMSKNLVEMTFRQTGYDAQISFKSITTEQVHLIASHPDVAEIGESIILGLAENKELAGRQVEIRWGDNSYAEHSFAMPDVGSLPQKADEIALDTLVLDRLNIPHELGQTITLQWRKDLTGDEILTSTFKLCGYWEGNQSVYASMAWVSRDYAKEMTNGIDGNIQGQLLGTHMAQVNLFRDNQIEADIQTILSDTGLTGLKYNVNLAYSSEIGATALQENIPMYLGMILVFLAGYLIIYNIFQISVTADIQFYGKLKTLGTTKKQLKRLIYGQANRLCLIAIPLGLGFGYLLGAVLVPVLVGTISTHAVVAVNWSVFVGSALFAWITVIFSCLRPARLAGKVSPIEALRYNDTSTSIRKKAKKGQREASLSGMAWANLGRNKKRTVTVICSLTLGLVLLSCFYAKNVSFDIEKYLSALTIADFELSDATDEDFIGGYNPYGNTLNNDLISSVETLDGLEKAGYLYSHQLNWDMDVQTVQNLKDFCTSGLFDYIENYAPDTARAIRDAAMSEKVDTVMYGLEGIPLETIVQEQYLFSGTYNADEFATGNYVLAIGPASEKEEFENGTALPTASVGEAVTIEGQQYTVMAVVYPVNSIEYGALETGVGNGFNLGFILPADTFRELWPDNTLRKLFFNVADEEIDATQKMLDSYMENVDSGLPVTSRKTMIEQYKSETRSSAVMGNTISVVIALVGILNFVNSMVTAIVSRRKEFAMIQSIGMTKRQLRKMLILEGLYYMGITLITSYIVSALAVGIGVRAMVAEGYSTFHFTLMPLVICTPILLIFAILIPYMCFKNLEKKSIVERLRETGE